MAIYQIPDWLIPAETPMLLSPEQVVAAVKSEQQLKDQIASLENQLALEVKLKLDALREAETERDAKQVAEARAVELTRENGDLNKRLSALEKPPAIIVPAEPEPDMPPIVRDAFSLCAVYIEDEQANDNQEQARARFNRLLPVMEFAAECDDIPDFIMFGNLQDTKFKELFKACQRLKRRYWQSPIQAFYIEGAQQQTVLIDLYKSLHDAGVYGGVIDDAQNLSAAAMEQVIDLWNKYVPGAPVMASFLASFDDVAAGYPHERYVDMRQWFIRQNESENVWFEKWETAHNAQVWAADCYRRKGGMMHSPERLKHMFEVALPMVEGIAWYSMKNEQTDHMKEHREMTAKIPNAVTMWSVIKECSALYQVAMRDRVIQKAL